MKANPTPQVVGINETPVINKLATAQVGASGSFSVQITAPPDYGGVHAIQANDSATSASPVTSFRIVPSFSVSPSSGPAGSPISVKATGLGVSTYSTNYCLYWDNEYVGYMSAVSTRGITNFTFYASGTPGQHYISIYEGNNGPGYLNPQQDPSLSYYDPPLVPFFANFTVTPETVLPATSTSGDAVSSGGLVGAASLAMLAVSFVGGGVFVFTRPPDQRRAITKSAAAMLIVVLVVVGGIGLYAITRPSSSTSTTKSPTMTTGASSSQTSSSGPTVTFTPVATVVRPTITVPVSTATTGPRITVTPTIASVEQNITISGQGFSPDAQLPLYMTTNEGNNLVGYKLVDQPLRNVTAGSDGSFAFTMKAPYTLGGVHYIVAGNLTEHSNGTLFIQRTAFISSTQGPAGTKITITMYGVGWTFNTNIVTLDYDNNYLGYACGFNSGGNVTMTIFATGTPGIHDIDIYPSVWFGPVTSSSQLPGDGQQVDYDNPLLTPQDHPNLMPSFHFTFLITSG